MPCRGVGQAAAVLPVDIYVCGAASGVGHMALRFCRGIGNWRWASNMTARRSHLGGRLYVCGGRHRQATRTCPVEC